MLDLGVRLSSDIITGYLEKPVLYMVKPALWDVSLVSEQVYPLI